LDYDESQDDGIVIEYDAHEEITEPIRSRPVRRRGICYSFKDLGYCTEGQNCKFAHVLEDDDSPRSRSRSPTRRPRRGRSRDRVRNENQHSKQTVFKTRLRPLGKQKRLVVENIPEEFCDISKVHEYFSKFGNLVNCIVDVPSRAALLEFTHNYEAQLCHSSPDVIFNNRFVKVFWSAVEAKPYTNRPKQPQVPAEILQEKKEQMEQHVEQVSQQQKELAKTRQALIAKQIEEQNSLLEKLKNPMLSVDERKVFMQGLEYLQNSIKDLISQQTGVSFTTSLNPNAAPFVPSGSFRPKTAHRSFVSNSQGNDATLEEKRKLFEKLQEQVEKV
jgi:hypothetical protein